MEKVKTGTKARERSERAPKLKAPRTRGGSKWKNVIVVFAMMLPGLAYLLINNYMPLVGLSLAFKEPDMSLNNIFNSPWCGFENFEILFQSSDIWLYIRNTVLYNVAFLIINFIIPISMAILFTFVRGKVKNVYQTLILLPYLMSWVIVSYVTYALFSGESGMLNAMITNAGGERVNFYGRDMQWLWPFVFIFFNTWKGTGFTFLFYYSAILAISPSLYDAAKLDGAGFWKQVRYVTVPGLKSTMVTMLIMGLSGIFRSDYGLFYLLSQNSGQLYEVSQTIDTFIYNSLKGQGDLVTSSAAGILQSLVGLVLVVSGNLVIKKIDPESSLF